MGKLREQMETDLQLKGLTPRTQAAYLREVRNLAVYFKKSPEDRRTDHGRPPFNAI
jgi:hypothetical protein